MAASVVLRTDVANVGKKGDVIDVADGFARNYLVPRGLAMPASAGAAAQAARMRRARDIQDAKDRESAEVVARSLVARVVTVTAKAGAGGKLFGSITATDVAEAIEAQTGVALDRRKLHLDEPIRTLGSHEVPVKLHADVEFRVTIEVVTA